MNTNSLLYGFGDDGYQVINATYSSDSIIGTMVTDCNNFHCSMEKFETDLLPVDNTTGNFLTPIQLPSNVAEKGGVNQLFRYSGRAFSAQDHYARLKELERKFITFQNNFSFVWISKKTHALSYRPLLEVIVRMAKDTISKEDKIENMRLHLEKCFDIDLTTSIT